MDKMYKMKQVIVVEYKGKILRRLDDRIWKDSENKRIKDKLYLDELEKAYITMDFLNQISPKFSQLKKTTKSEVKND